MDWYEATYIVGICMTSAYMFYKDNDLFISIISGIAWPITWFGLIVKATT